MAYTNSGYKRSMTITVVKSGDDGSTITTTYDGRQAFPGHAALTDDEFAKLTRNGTDGSWDIRLAAFKSYLEPLIGADAYASIPWTSPTLGPILVLSSKYVRLMAIAETQGTTIIAASYNSSNNSIANVDDNITVYFTVSNPNVEQSLSIQALTNYSQATYECPNGYDIRDVVITRLTQETNNSNYNTQVDILNEW